MAKAIDKASYWAFLRKGDEHLACGNDAIKNKRYDAAVTNYSIAIINYLDSLSVNRFGKDLSSDNHEGAPHILLKNLSGAGITDFKGLANKCGAVLKLKNVASYRAEELGKKEAEQAKGGAQETKTYVESKIDRSITSI